MTTVIVVLVSVVIVVLLVVALLAALRRRRSRTLHRQFGPEYDRTRDRMGSRREAERHLVDIRDRREQVDIRPLAPEERERYQREWQRVQATFVDLPAEAVAEADLLVSRVMRDRGYPVDDFEDRASMVAVDHPDVVEHYRFAHSVRQRQLQGPTDTEALREALVHYRALAENLLDPRQAADTSDTRQAADAQSAHPPVNTSTQTPTSRDGNPPESSWSSPPQPPPPGARQQPPNPPPRSW